MGFIPALWRDTVGRCFRKHSRSTAEGSRFESGPDLHRQQVAEVKAFYDSRKDGSRHAVTWRRYGVFGVSVHIGFPFVEQAEGSSSILGYSKEMK